MTFGVAFGIEADDNRGFFSTDKVDALEVYSDLSFGILTQTRTQSLSFDIGGRLRALDTDIRFSTDNGFVEPFAALNYNTFNRSSSFSFSAETRESDVSDPETLRENGITEFISASTATRRRSQVDASYDWGNDRRFGFGVFATYLNNEFRDGTVLDIDGEVVEDSETSTVGLRARFDLSEVATLNTTLSYQGFEQTGVPGIRETISFTNALSIERPRGPVNYSLTLTDTEEGRRIATSIGRTLALPTGSLSGAIGVTREATSDDIDFTGNLNYVYNLPRGQLNFGVSREVTSNDIDDSENLRTEVRFGYDYDLTPLSRLRLNASWAEAEETFGGLTSTNATLGATYTHELASDWDLSVGYRHSLRDNDITGRARNNTLFIEMNKDFISRF